MINEVQADMINQTDTTAIDRKSWVKPELTLIEAGSAEAGGQVKGDGGIGQS